MGLGGDPATAHGGTERARHRSRSTTAGTADDAPSSRRRRRPIDLEGYTNVHLQYYRWLGVEDGAYDQATITANGTPVWRTSRARAADDPRSTCTSTKSGGSTMSISRRGRTTGQAAHARVSLASTRGARLRRLEPRRRLHRRVARLRPATCGNGAVDPGETCDDGNTTDGDGCSATCQTEVAPIHVDAAAAIRGRLEARARSR